MENFAPSADAQAGAASSAGFNPSYEEDDGGLRGSDDSLGADTVGSRDPGPRRTAGGPGVSFVEQEGGTVPSSQAGDTRFTRSNLETGRLGKPKQALVRFFITMGTPALSAVARSPAPSGWKVRGRRPLLFVSCCPRTAGTSTR